MYFDQLPSIGNRIADFASLAEIEAISLAMRERWKELGREIRALGGKGSEATDLERKRRCINRGLKLIGNGDLPLHPEDYFGAGDILAYLHARREAVQAETIERKQQEIAQTAIDDAAWNAELKRRAEIERYLGNVDHDEHIS